MSERLFIRLGTKVEHACSWLVWSEQEQEIIASGELNSAKQLNSLSQRAGKRPVDVLVQASAMTLTEVELPEKGQRQAIKALPFMLEEAFAEDVDKLHFVAGARNGNQLSVAVVAHQQMQLWLEWLSAAGLVVKRLLPDCLALPLMGCQWATMVVGDELLLRTSTGQGHSIPSQWQSMLLPKLLPVQDADDLQDNIAVANYSELQLEGVSLNPQPVELPMLVLAKGALQAPLNLLTGPYRPKREYSKNLLVWKNAAIVLGVAILLSLLNKGFMVYHTNQQITDVQQQSVEIFKQATGFNRVTNANLRPLVRTELKKIKGSGNGSVFFKMLTLLEPAFKQVPDLVPNTVRFDGNRGELRMQITAKNYSSVERFKQALGKNFDTKSGVMNSLDDKVTTTLTIRSK
ncbi:type II secretion system protein GspL [Parashewanella spongiae]|uniref:Type II secretion system protein L n=1 Tax=Parashewanella spongiae TaxID=342950 RepID=A0A3A6TWM5_9GAMM|nr:type II secretion system protein GspL [Parashewanella spongiae]MCL1077154.1 type II secretion system protein GspL [Parashewanella spongiae]RJY18823.1 type II secretion system protein GspL [Parashewanella spongiae]